MENDAWVFREDGEEGGEGLVEGLGGEVDGRWDECDLQFESLGLGVSENGGEVQREEMYIKVGSPHIHHEVFGKGGGLVLHERVELFGGDEGWLCLGRWELGVPGYFGRHFVCTREVGVG